MDVSGMSAEHRGFRANDEAYDYKIMMLFIPSPGDRLALMNFKGASESYDVPENEAGLESLMNSVTPN